MISILSIIANNDNYTINTMIVSGYTQLSEKHMADIANNYAYRY